jgi:hypothetical protein
VLSVRFGLGLFISEDGILHSHCRENLKTYIRLLSYILEVNGSNICRDTEWSDAVSNVFPQSLQ